MLSDNARSTADPCLSFQVSPSAPMLTSSPGVRFSGSRLTLSATYRLSASLPCSDQQTVLLMTAMLSHPEAVRGSDHRESEGTLKDFELAARCCLTGLYVRLMLGRPAIVALSDGWRQASDGSDLPPAVKLKLEHVRAASSTEAEYYFRPTLFALSRGHLPQDALADECAFRLAVIGEGTERVSLWALRRGLEVHAADLVEASLPMSRSDLVEAVEPILGERYRQLEGDLMGLDEWRFQEGLRISFTLASARARGVLSPVEEEAESGIREVAP